MTAEDIVDQAPATATQLPQSHGSLYPTKTWRYGDTKRLVVCVAPLCVIAVASLLSGNSQIIGIGLFAAIILAAAAVIAINQSLSRRTLGALEKERRQNQALLSLHHVLPLRAPLPPMAGWACTPELAAIVVDEVLGERPSVVVETGSGASTLVAGYALERIGAGRIISLDHDANYAAVSRMTISRHGLTEWAEVVDAPLVAPSATGQTTRWYDTSGLDDRLQGSPIDLLVVDGPPMVSGQRSRWPALPLLWSKLSPGAVIIVDDARRPDEVATVERWLRDYPLSVTYIDSDKGVAVLRRTG